MDDSNELVARLSTAVGIIMEDATPIALSQLPESKDQLDKKLRGLEEASQAATALIQAAQVLARRNIR